MGRHTCRELILPNGAKVVPLMDWEWWDNEATEDEKATMTAFFEVLVEKAGSLPSVPRQ